MKGFAKSAVLVLPRYATYENRSMEWRRLFRASLQKIINYMELMNIKVYAFNSDELSDEISLKGLRTYDIVTSEDKLLLETFLLGGEKVPKGEDFENKEEIFNEARKKFPVKRGTSIEEKKGTFIKRDKWIAKQVIKQSKIVINCELASKAYYTVDSKPGDERLVIRINLLNFSPEVKLSGEDIDAIAVFNYAKAYSPLYSWEV